MFQTKYPDPFLDSEIPNGGASAKDGLSERKPLLKPWEEGRQTPRSVYVEPHNNNQGDDNVER